MDSRSKSERPHHGRYNDLRSRRSDERLPRHYSADAKARSDAYFEGGYWIQLWGFLITVAVMLLILRSRCGFGSIASSTRAVYKSMVWKAEQLSQR